MSKARAAFDTMLSNIFEWVGSWFVVEYEEEVEEAEEAEEEDDGKENAELTPAQHIAGGHKEWLLENDIPLTLLRNPENLSVVTREDARRFMFNVHVWQTLHGVPNEEFGFQIEASFDTATWKRYYFGALYTSKGLMERFLDWEAKYNERFGTSGNDLLPNLPDAAIINATVISHRGFNYNNYARVAEPWGPIFKQWFWIIENCSGPVWVTERAFVFGDAADAVLFKLSPIYEEK
jgi:hypothetical protein